MSGEDLPAQRKTDANSGGGVIDTTGGNSTVYINSLLAAVNGSTGTGHGEGAHSFHAWQTTSGSGSVFAHGKAVNFSNNSNTCGHVQIGGSGDVFVGDSIDQDVVANRVMNGIDEEDAVNPGGSVGLIKSAIDSGAISALQLAAGATPKVGVKDATLATATTATILSADCTNIHALFPTEENPTVEPPVGDSIDSIQLSTNYTVGSLTRKPFVVFDHTLRDSSSGLSLEQLLCNLKLLAINIVEPIHQQYPNLVLTNTWRPADSSSSSSQHPKAQAVDMQFKGAAKKDYFYIAKWIKNNLVFDQLLLEYKTTGSGLPWIHVSFNKRNNKRQVLTLLNNSTYSQGLVDLSDTD